MMDVLNFVGQDIDHFLGTCIVLSIIFGGIAGIVRAAKGHPETSCDD